MFEKKKFEKDSNRSGNAGIDTALAEVVTTYTDDAPAPPDINKILTERAGRPRPASTAWSSNQWLRPALSGLFGLAVIGGGAYALIAANRSDGGQVVVPATVAENDDQAPTTTTPEGATGEEGGTADGEETDGTAPMIDPDVVGETLAGSDAAGDLPESAPETYWAIRSTTYDLIQVESRTGRVLNNLGGWGEPNDVGEGELVQALNSVEVAGDGTLYVDDCCEPAFGSIHKLGPDKPFDPAVGAWRTGLSPSLSPSGELMMFNVGGALMIDRSAVESSTGAGTVAQLGEIGFDDPIRFVPLTWLDDDTIAVRIFGGDVEEIRIYELGADGLTERQTARRVIADRFHMDGATRADGMLVVAGRRPNGNSLGLAGGGDLVADVIDPQTGEMVAEFDLPDDIFDIDYDRTGRYLMTSGDDGIVRWFGVGQSGVLSTEVIYAAWD